MRPATAAGMAAATTLLPPAAPSSSSRFLPPRPRRLVGVASLLRSPPAPGGSCCCSCRNGETGEAPAASSRLEMGSGTRRRMLGLGLGVLALPLTASDAGATRVQYYATVGERLCDLNFVKSGLGYCDVAVGTGVEPPPGQLINIHYTARFEDGAVFDSSYKRGRPLTLRIGLGKADGGHTTTTVDPVGGGVGLPVSRFRDLRRPLKSSRCGRCLARQRRSRSRKKRSNRNVSAGAAAPSAEPAVGEVAPARCAAADADEVLGRGLGASEEPGGEHQSRSGEEGAVDPLPFSVLSDELFQESPSHGSGILKETPVFVPPLLALPAPVVAADLSLAMEQVQETHKGDESASVDSGNLTKGEVMDILNKVENFMESQASETARLIGVSDAGVDKGHPRS